MNLFFLIAIVVMIFLVIFQIAKAGEYVSVLKGEEKSRRQNNRINGFMLISFLVLGLIGVYVCNEWFFHKTLFPQGSASVEGEEVDRMMYITLAVTGAVFIITQVCLFWFAFKYQEKDGQRAFYFPHNNKLELIWTVVPAIFLTVLVAFGLIFWWKITGDAPKNAIVVEVTGHQFGWEYRYPGTDKVLGKKDYKKYTSTNILGVDFNDPASLDDIHVSTTMYLPKGVPVKFVINAQDVIHDVGLSHFRLKMDAIPGIPTTLWFTPKYTTEEMKVRTGNANFVYELSCDQMCGSGHFSMRGVIEVVEPAAYEKWLKEQKPQYFTIYPDRDPAAKKDTVAAKIDTVKMNMTTAAVAVAN